MLEDSIPIEGSFGPVAVSFYKREEIGFVIVDKSLLVSVWFVKIKGFNFAKSSKELKPMIFSLKYLKLVHSGKISKFASVRRISVVVINIEE